MKSIKRILAVTAVTAGVLASSATAFAGGSNTFQYPTVVEGAFVTNTSKQAQKRINPGNLTALVAESDGLYAAKGCTVGVASGAPRKYTCSGKIVVLTWGLGNNVSDVYLTWTLQ